MIIDFIIEDLMLNSYLQKNFHTLLFETIISFKTVCPTGSTIEIGMLVPSFPISIALPVSQSSFIKWLFFCVGENDE